MSTKKRKFAAISIGTLLLLLSGSLFGYWWQHGMSKAHPYHKGLPSLERHVLVATQGSAFKDSLVASLAEQLASLPAFVNVIDISELDAVNGSDWDAIILVHTWEFGEAPQAVTDFVAPLSDRGKIVDVTTSGSGHEKIAGVDFISSASVIEDVPALVKQIRTRVETHLAPP